MPIEQTSGYKHYDDALKGEQYTLDELRNLNIEDEVLILDTQDNDDNYSLENRLFFQSVNSINNNYIMFGGYSIYFNEPYPSEYFLILKTK